MWKITALSCVIGFVVSCINFILGKFMRIFGAYELYNTKTDYFISVAQKLSLVKFILFYLSKIF